MEDKARIATHHNRLCSWLCDAAYPLWATRGVDAAGGFHERLGQDGQPLAEPRRSRVNPRQAYCFAVAPSLGWRGDIEKLVRHGLDYWIARYRREDGLFRTLVNADGSSRDDRALLYDQAFGLLAFNVSAVGESRALRERQALELHGLVVKHMKRAGQPGFETGVPPSTPLQSNPHMHLFEAALAGCEVCSESAMWKSLADEIATLALDKFIQPSTGALHEFFDAQWNPAPGMEGRIVEPGHQFEWAWLLLRWGGQNPRARAAALKLIDIGESHGVRNGLAMNSLLDDYTPHDAGARLWPQTERLKAASIAARITGEARYFSMAVAAADGLMRYLETPIAGLWRDRIDAEGKVVDEPAPASSFYHLVAAISEVSALARL